VRGFHRIRFWRCRIDLQILAVAIHRNQGVKYEGLVRSQLERCCHKILDGCSPAFRRLSRVATVASAALLSVAVRWGYVRNAVSARLPLTARYRCGEERAALAQQFGEMSKKGWDYLRNRLKTTYGEDWPKSVAQREDSRRAKQQAAAVAEAATADANAAAAADSPSAAAAQNAALASGALLSWALFCPSSNLSHAFTCWQVQMPASNASSAGEASHNQQHYSWRPRSARPRHDRNVCLQTLRGTGCPTRRAGRRRKWSCRAVSPATTSTTTNALTQVQLLPADVCLDLSCISVRAAPGWQSAYVALLASCIQIKLLLCCQQIKNLGVDLCTVGPAAFVRAHNPLR